MRVIALDVASTTGFAIWPGEGWPQYGSQKFKAADLGERATEFADWLAATVAAHDITDVGVEPPVPVMSGNTNIETETWLKGAFLRVLEVAHRRRLNVWRVHESSWRSHFLGVTRAPKDVEAKKRRTWLKRVCIEECRARGFDPKDDNAADALGILSWVRAMTDADYARQFIPQLLKERRVA